MLSRRRFLKLVQALAATPLIPGAKWLEPQNIGRGHLTYYEKVLATGPIACWPLWERSGDVIQDLGPNGYTGRLFDHWEWEDATALGWNGDLCELHVNGERRI